MYKVELPNARETFEKNAIERRRKLDEERMKRIFDPKIRVLGIDVDALDEQIRIKNEMKRIEDEREAAFAKSMKETTSLLQNLDTYTLEQRRKHLASINDFRRAHQNPYQRRDYDLYDPNLLKNSRPPRILDNDGSVSGLQRFEGEDLSSEKRKKDLKMQMRVWSLQGVKEREAIKQRELEEKRQYEEFQHKVQQKGMALTKSVQDKKTEIAKADNEFNRRMAQYRKLKEEHDKYIQECQNQEEILANLNGRFLNENPEMFETDGSRIDAFKGMTIAQKIGILETQKRQRIEAELKRQSDQEREFQAALQETANNIASLELQKEKERQKRNENIAVRIGNEEKSKDDMKRKLWMDKVLYTNQPSEDYFAQFNTTSR